MCLVITLAVFHLSKYNNVTLNYLMIDIAMKNKAGISYRQDLQIFVVAYGTKGYQNDVPSSMWDKVYELQNGTLGFQTPAKMTKS